MDVSDFSSDEEQEIQVIVRGRVMDRGDPLDFYANEEFRDRRSFD